MGLDEQKYLNSSSRKPLKCIVFIFQFLSENLKAVDGMHLLNKFQHYTEGLL